jgi:hypothetical protein
LGQEAPQQQRRRPSIDYTLEWARPLCILSHVMCSSNLGQNTS